MPPLVSILIPAYNAATYVEATLRSALSQTWPRVEVVVVDDGSKDQTLEVAKRYESSRVKVMSQPNAGAAAARNRAYRASQGDYIQFLDADDLLAPDKIEIQMRRLLREEPDAVAACRWARFHADPARHWEKPEPFWRDCEPVEWLATCWESNSMMHPGAWLLSRSLSERAGPWDETLSLDDDAEYFTRVVLASRGVLFCREAVTYYRSSIGGSLSSQRSPRALDSGLRSIEATTAAILACENSERTRRACVRRLQEFVFSVYLDAPPELVRAEKLVDTLGGERFSPGGGRLFRLGTSVLGWRRALRLQRLWRNMLAFKTRGTSSLVVAATRETTAGRNLQDGCNSGKPCSGKNRAK